MKSVEVKIEQEGKWMYSLAEQLYPICRSITGNGVRQTLSILNDFIPLVISEIPSGTKALDWEIPFEWNIRDAWIKDAKGEKIVDFKKHNLHVLNYSEPVAKKVDLKELKDHSYTLPGFPEWIPYRTSYYKRQWGFCLTYNQFKNLKDGEYEVFIDSDLQPGSLTYAECFIPGTSKDEVLISCHICHPSLCNDNLSGIVIAANMAGLLRKTKPYYSYRFLFVPGTIGSITWLSKNEDKIGNIKHGLVLTLLGDSSSFHYKKSRQGNAEIDQILEYLLKDSKDSKILDYSPYGYDERQYCSPGFNLPVGSLSRKPFGEFPEYHTSADNLDFINPINLGGSLNLLLEIIKVLEGNKTFINTNPKGEPQLGKRGLYDNAGGQEQGKNYQMALLWILNLSDGNNSLLDIAKKSGIEFEILLSASEKLLEATLLMQENNL
jgi:aminopeptidase-like protein